MAVTFENTLPAINRRVPIDSTISVVFSGALDPLTTTIQNIIFENAVGISVPFSVILSPSSTANIKPDSILTEDTVYVITLTTGVLDAGLTPILETEIKFITEETDVIPVIDLSLDGNVNDIIFKNNLLIELFDGKQLIDTGNKFNFEMVPSNFDEITKKYSNAVQEKITFNNKDVFLDKIISQELNIFDVYLQNIEDLSVISTSEINDIKKTLLIKSFAVNASTGLITNIEYLLKLFGKAIGNNFIDVEPDPFEAFVYHISTNIPKTHWTSIIKEIVHPVSWLDNYMFIDQTASFQKDATASTYFKYFQLEQYEWTDNYILGSDDFSVGFKGLRQGLEVHGQLLATTIPKTDSVGTPPTSYIPAVNSGDQNLVANYANVIHATGTGVALELSNIFTTDVDLSAFTTNQFGIQSGKIVSDFYLTIAEGPAAGFYEIATNTNATSNNTITISTIFPETDLAAIFWITDREGTSFRELLAVINVTRTLPRFVLSYLQAGQVGTAEETSNESRLVFDATGDLQLIIIDGSPVTSFTDPPSDTTFLFDDEDFPALFVTSTLFNDVGDQIFGNTVLQNDVTVTNEIATGRFYEIASMNEPDTSDIQTITFVDPINTSPVGDPGIEVTNLLTITGMALGGNNVVDAEVLSHDYVAKTVTILNEPGGSESDPSGTPDAEQKIQANFNVITNIKPGSFSEDEQLFTGYTIFFNDGIVDPCDFNATNEFDFQYAEWDADINYPKVGGSDATYLDFVSDLTATSNFDSMTAFGVYKKYYPTSTNVSWALGCKIYEITAIDLSTDISIDALGPLFGIVEREELTVYSEWVMETNYLVGDRVFGTNGGSAPNFIFEVQSGTLSGASEPTWDTTIGNSTSSASGGDITWLTIDQKNLLVRFLDTNPNEVWLEDNSLSTFTDQTTEAIDTITSDDVNLLPATIESNDAFYIGSDAIFSHFIIDISTPANNSLDIWTIKWEYFNASSGDGWQELILNSAGDNIDSFHPSIPGLYDLIYTTPTDWIQTTISSGSGNLYWLRGRVTSVTSQTTQPKAKAVFINTGFNTDKFYTVKESETGPLSIGSGPTTDTVTEFGGEISRMNRKISLQSTIPDADEYVWTSTVVSGTGPDTQIEFVKNIVDIMSNKYILFGKENTTYNVNLTVNLFEFEVTQVITVGDTSGSLAGRFFNLFNSDDVTQYYVWYNVNGDSNSIDPAISGATAIQVDIEPNDNAASVALFSKNAIEVIGSGFDFKVIIDGTITNQMTIENLAQGATTNSSDGPSGQQTGFTITTTFEGRSNTEDLFDFTGL